MGKSLTPYKSYQDTYGPLQTSCASNLRNRQDVSIRSGFSDFQFNFMISEYGIVEGRGWDCMPESKIFQNPVQSEDMLSIAFLYTYGSDYEEFEDEFLKTLQKLIHDGVTIGKLDKDVKWEYHEDWYLHTNFK